VIFGFQSSLRLQASFYPIFSVWQANQIDNAPPVDQSLAEECGLVHLHRECAEVRKLDRPLFSFLSALFGGATLGDAMTKADLDEGALTDALAFLFNEGLVSSVTPRERS
jgi:hypothetical protein